jgi:hypothetical protein
MAQYLGKIAWLLP